LRELSRSDSNLERSLELSVLELGGLGMLTLLLIEVPYAGLPLAFCTLVYQMIVHGRLSGTLFRRYEDRIGW